MRIVGYGICGGGEASRYLEDTLKCFKTLTDETIILLNGECTAEKEMIESYGFLTVKDDREWGKNQHHIKEDFLKNHVSKLEPEATVCLDMDEVLDVSREDLEEYSQKGEAWYVYVVNMWEEGYRSDWSFWNIRFWRWSWQEKLGDGFFKFENRPLHCGLAPKWCYHLNLHAPFILRHYGLKLKDDRMKKVRRYEKYDPNQVYREPSYYEALKTDHFEEYDQEKIQKELDTHIESIKQPLNKELPMLKNKNKEYLVVREADGFVFGVPENLLYQQLKQTFKGKAFRLLSEVEKPRDVAPVVEESQESEKYTFVYVANHGNTHDDDTEGHISRALRELGHRVIEVQEGDPVPDGDYLLCHKWIPDVPFSGQKVCWYFDLIFFEGKYWGSREYEAKALLENVDYFFATDTEGIKSLNSSKCHVLRQGIGYHCDTGRQVPAPDVAFTGTIYEGREEWLDTLKRKVSGFAHYANKFNQQLNDLCVSAKIMVGPDYPVSDNYWSNRVYNTIGRGAFMLHKRASELEKELQDSKEIVYYDDIEDLIEKIDYYLEHEEEREAIRKAGVEKVRSKYHYKDRVKELCSKLSIKEN